MVPPPIREGNRLSLAIRCAIASADGAKYNDRMNASLTDWLSAAEDSARLGGAILEEWRGRFSAREKAHADLVTEADHASQKAVRSFLLTRFPDHAFLGE